ncbi:sugar transferase [uncultured Ruminococcus sp.]|uniref:sugar transferase n=1 Tax=uncultured Ruminococcus sp. TaxID=165186 RepID=UPI00265FC414|nr:sugar transferase [uncultured Ruminococcus sp.]
MSLDKKKIGKILGVTAIAAGTAFVALKAVAKKKKPDTVYDNEPEQKNPLEGKKVVFVEDENDKENADGVKGHLEAVGDSDYEPKFYSKYVKRGMDIIFSFGGLVVLSPVFAVTALAIKIEDPGPVLFTQKRLGQNKQYFKLHKFRSMKMCTPHDVPTHMLDNPDQYITKVGKFIRAHSLDELPQIWDIFVGNMSVIGPRPGLWNQDLLTAERDRYGANDVKPGLTGWAQINGRDELEIPDKAKLDGEYVQKLGPIMDAKVFLGSLHVFGKDDSVVEGGTGELKRCGIVLPNDGKTVYPEDQYQIASHCRVLDKKVFNNTKKITVSIVTYNSADEIDILMKSLQSSSLFDKMTVFVVDNASKDNTVRIIKEEYPWVRVIESKENLGFGAGHNLVINNIQSDFHLIVNPDISVSENAIKDSIQYLQEHTDISVLTPYVMNVDGTQQYLPKKNPSMKYMIGGMFESKFKFCKKLREEYTLQNKKVTNPIDVEFCTGAFMVTRTASLHKVGGFDERYFLHFEDADLTRELRKVGRAVYNPDIKVTHKWHRENKKINKSFWVALKSMFIYMKKWRGKNA